MGAAIQSEKVKEYSIIGSITAQNVRESAKQAQETQSNSSRFAAPPKKIHPLNKQKKPQRKQFRSVLLKKCQLIGNHRCVWERVWIRSLKTVHSFHPFICSPESPADGALFKWIPHSLREASVVLGNTGEQSELRFKWMAQVFVQYGAQLMCCEL